MEPIHYPLYVIPPKEVDLTHEQFNHLSYYGMSTFFIAFPFCVEVVPDFYKVYGMEGMIGNIAIFALELGYKAYDIGDEMVLIEVPRDSRWARSLERYFKKYFLK